MLIKVTKLQVIKLPGSKDPSNLWVARVSSEIKRGPEAAHHQDKELTITSRQMTIGIQKCFPGALTTKASLVWDLN